jgi:NAD-dependent DNA ligase
MAAQNIIENISLKNSKTIKAADIQKGDRVVIGYDEDLPYIVQRIKQSSVLNQKISGSEEDISVYEWLGENFGEIKEINPIPGMSMDGV